MNGKGEIYIGKKRASFVTLMDNMLGDVGLTQSTFHKIEHNGVTIEWDGLYRLYVSLTSKWMGKVG